MKNKYEIRGEDTIIFLNKKDGTIVEVIICTDDLHIAESFPNNWFDHRGYVCGWTDQRRHTKSRLGWSLHRLILGAPNDKIVDHINNNTLDNRRVNLRLATKSENCQNLKKERKNNTSGVRGVTWSKRSKKWSASFQVNYKKTYLGDFFNLEDAENAIKTARAKLMPFSSEVTEGYVSSEFSEFAREKELSRGYRNNKSSGFKGVSWSKKSSKWQVNILFDGKIKYFYFDDLDEAKLKSLELRKQRDDIKRSGNQE